MTVLKIYWVIVRKHTSVYLIKPLQVAFIPQKHISFKEIFVVWVNAGSHSRVSSHPVAWWGETFPFWLTNRHAFNFCSYVSFLLCLSRHIWELHSNNIQNKVTLSPHLNEHWVQFPQGHCLCASDSKDSPLPAAPSPRILGHQWGVTKRQTPE